MCFQRPADLLRALHRRFRAGPKNQGAAITGRQAKELAFRFRGTDRTGPAHDFLQLLQLLALLANEQLRVTDDIEEENVPDLEA
ncbi:MAG TPA: hypothetical protein VH207_11585 [Chthoniobacterales bacterium]|nr:hypothetical protein [Chthoniobacterales bacterium]